MNTNDSNPEEKWEERKATIEVKKEIYAERIFAEINKVKADLENQIRSRDSKVENLETTIEELRRQVPVSQKNLSNSELLEQLKEKDSRILLMGSNSKRIITQMKQKLLTKNEKIRKIGEENLNNAKRIKLLEEELSKHNENLNSDEVKDAKLVEGLCEIKPATNDLDVKRDHFESNQNVVNLLVNEGDNNIGTKPDDNPIDTKLSADKEDQSVTDDKALQTVTEVDNNEKAVNNEMNVIVDDTKSIGCRSTSNKLDLNYSKNVSLKISDGEKILGDEVAPANPSQNVEAIENFRDICVGKNGSLKITVSMASEKSEFSSNNYTNMRRKTCHSDADDHSKDANDHTKDADYYTKDVDAHNNDADDHNKNADIHNKDADENTKDADNHKEAHDHTKDAHDHTKDAVHHTKDETINGEKVAIPTNNTINKTTVSTTLAPQPQVKTQPSRFKQQKVQIVRKNDGKIQVSGLMPGQQLVQMPDGKLQIFSLPAGNTARAQSPSGGIKLSTSTGVNPATSRTLANQPQIEATPGVANSTLVGIQSLGQNIVTVNNGQLVVQGPDLEAATNIARQLASGQARLANIGGKQVLLISTPNEQARGTRNCGTDDVADTVNDDIDVFDNEDTMKGMKEKDKDHGKAPEEDSDSIMKSVCAPEDCGSMNEGLVPASGDLGKDLFVRIKVSGPKRTVVYKMKKTIVLKKLMTMYSERAGLPLSCLEFTYLAQTIHQHETPDQLNMKQSASIHVSTKKPQNN